MPASSVALDPRPIRFIRRGQLVSAAPASASRTLLDYLREDLGQTGTKEGCAEGDCGACTVVLAELNEQHDGLKWSAVNSCIRFVSSIDGAALYTVEDLADDSGALHPAQQAMADAVKRGNDKLREFEKTNK